MQPFHLGQFVFLRGSGVGIVAMLADGHNVPEDHVGVWFGTTTDSGSPIVCTIPAEYFTTAPEPTIQH